MFLIIISLVINILYYKNLFFIMYFDGIILSYAINYLLLYNLNIFFLIVIIMNFNNLIKYFSNLIYLNHSNIYKNMYIVVIFSISGIPPFLFFFYKLNLIFFIFLINYNILFYLYIILFVSLYFYLQTLKYVLNVNITNNIIISDVFLKFNYVLVFFFFLLILINLFGLFLIDDILLLVSFI